MTTPDHTITWTSRTRTSRALAVLLRRLVRRTQQVRRGTRRGTTNRRRAPHRPDTGRNAGRVCRRHGGEGDVSGDTKETAHRERVGVPGPGCEQHIAPGPRVRVVWDVWRPTEPGWIVRCPYCFAGIHRFTWSAAMADAIEHATGESCDGLRLARLLRELEGLREKWISQAARTVAFDWAASDLTAVLARAAGGTG